MGTEECADDRTPSSSLPRQRSQALESYTQTDGCTDERTSSLSLPRRRYRALNGSSLPKARWRPRLPSTCSRTTPAALPRQRRTLWVMLQTLPFTLLPALLLMLLQSSQSEVEELVLKGNELTALGKYIAAERVFARVATLQPDSGMAQMKHGISLVAQERRLEALGAFEEALRLLPGTAASAMTARKLFSRSSNVLIESAPTPAAALLLSEQAVRVLPSDGEAYAKLGLACGRLARNAEALVALEHAAALKPLSVPAQHNAGVVAISEGELARASAHLERALSLSPAHLASHVVLRTMHPRDDPVATSRLRRALAAAEEPTSISARSPTAARQREGSVPSVPAGEAMPATEASRVAEAHWRVVARTLVGEGTDAARALPTSSSFGDESSNGDDGSPSAGALAQQLRTRGYAVADGVLGTEAVRQLRVAVSELEPQMAAGAVLGDIHARRQDDLGGGDGGRGDGRDEWVSTAAAEVVVAVNGGISHVEAAAEAAVESGATGATGPAMARRDRIARLSFTARDEAAPHLTANLQASLATLDPGSSPPTFVSRPVSP